MPDDNFAPIGIAAPEITEAEEQAVIEVLRSGRLAQGPRVQAFEETFSELQNVGHSIAVSNGTTALHVSLHIAGVRPGDEVLIPAFTFAASANAVLAVGAIPVFVDIAEDFLIDLEDAATKTTERTTAIMPVHLYGLMTDMQAVSGFAERHSLAIIEDAAQAHLATRGGVSAGATGFGAFSFYATKNAMTGEGGMVTTSDPDAADAARRFRNHGMTTRYTHVEWGLNFRLTEIQAALGSVQLGKLPSWTRRRQYNAQYLTENLPEVFETPRTFSDADHVFHQFTTIVPENDRDRILEGFHEHSISADVYYPTPVPLQPAFEGLDATGRYPRAEAAAKRVICLPIHHQLSDSDLERIASAAKNITA